MSRDARDTIQKALDHAWETWGGERTGTFTEEEGAREVLKRLHEAVYQVTTTIKSIEKTKAEAEAAGMDYDDFLVFKHTGRKPFCENCGLDNAGGAGKGAGHNVRRRPDHDGVHQCDECYEYIKSRQVKHINVKRERRG